MSPSTSRDPDEQVKDTREEFENQSQLNANMASDSGYGWQTNRKRTFDAYQDVDLGAARRSQSHLDDVQLRSLTSYDQLLTLQARLNEEHFTTISERRHRLATLEADRARYADDAEYVTRYDLSNPVTTGVGDTVRAGAATAQRIVDTTGAVAGAGTAVSAEAVAAAVAKQVDATVTPVLAVLQQMVQTLANMQASIANVLNQVQPKST